MAIVRIARQFRTGTGQRGVHPVGGRGDDEPVEVLEAPIVVHQFAGQPVDQFGVLRRATLATKVEESRRQGRTKMPIPQVIYRHPCGQRIAWIGDPAGQGCAASGAVMLRRHGRVVLG